MYASIIYIRNNYFSQARPFCCYNTATVDIMRELAGASLWATPLLVRAGVAQSAGRVTSQQTPASEF
jgi:hypothetical protein